MSPKKRPSRPVPDAPPPEPPRASRRRAWLFAALAAVLAGGAAWAAWRALGPGGAGPTDEPAAEFVGAAACASCHAAQHAAWQESQHALAMLETSERSVLGDFDDARFTYAGTTTSFFRRGDRFVVRTDGPTGELQDFEVKYTFGVYPLQQYLLELPGGRLQALTIAWDARPREEGGQRWFHLYPDERITHTDELHWTGMQFNWNYMCADCHSTDLRKNFDAQVQQYSTRWAEINVACEACHGPGSRHVEWARGHAEGRAPRRADLGLTIALDQRRDARWQIDPATGTARRSAPREGDAEVELCAQCHSRRAQFADGFQAGEPLMDHYLPSTLEPGLYWPDGQQRDEVYIHASFLQSRMYQAGVTCSDCHDPHSGKTRAAGNALCGQCHLAAKYDTREHHHHEPGTSGAQCVACHMAQTSYMIVDPRRDHSFRVPRPDLAAELGVPDACTGCHQGRPAEWAAERAREWYGDLVGFQTFAAAFAADERGEAGAPGALAALARDAAQPYIVRASALERVSDTPTPAALEAARASLSDPEARVRRAALAVIESVPPGERVALAAPLLRDPSRAVRMQAAWVLAPVAGSIFVPEQRADLERAAEEFIAAQRYNADRPESLTTLGTFLAQLGRLPEAEAQYLAALDRARDYVPAYVNLADLYRAQGREADALRVLRDAVALAPGDATLRHALGLALVRVGDADGAVAELRRAAELAPGDARFAYVYAVALHSSGRFPEAVRVLEQALSRHPESRDLLFALATFHRDAGQRDAALRYAERLARSHPDDPEARQLAASLR